MAQQGESAGKLVRVIFVHDDDEIVQLEGEAATNWLDAINNAVNVASIHGSLLPKFEFQALSISQAREIFE